MLGSFIVHIVFSIVKTNQQSRRIHFLDSRHLRLNSTLIKKTLREQRYSHDPSQNEQLLQYKERTVTSNSTNHSNVINWIELDSDPNPHALRILPPIDDDASAPKKTVEHQRQLLCIHFVGRLGNEMFQYASALGLAVITNRIPVCEGSTFLVNALKIPPLNGDSESYLSRCHRAEKVDEKSCCTFHEKFFQLDPSKDFRVGSYLQSWKYFDHIKNQVRGSLTFDDDVRAEAGTAIWQLRQTHNCTLVGIHIRRGDYLLEHHQQMGYITAPVSYVINAMTYMRNKFGDVHFVVATDDTWFQDNVPNTYNDVTMLSRRDPEVDLTILASLDHIIITVGSFGWWAGYLNPGITVYMRHFFNPNTNIGSQFYPNGSDYIYPDWIGL